MNERLSLHCLAGGAANHQPGRRRDVVMIGAAVKHISSGRTNGRFRRRSIRPGERGQTMVEMAVVLPIFLVFVFAIIEIGRAWGAKQTLTIAARDGARILAMPYGADPRYAYASEDEVKSAADAAVKASMNASGVPVIADTKINPVKITPGGDGIFNTADDEIVPYTNVTRGDRVGIQITHPFETPAPILLRMFDNVGGSPAQSAINMGVTCYTEHE